MARLPATALLTALLLGAAGCTTEQSDCSSGQTFCGGVCSDLQSDRQNCGTCFNFCGSGATCVSGVCRCPPGQEICGGGCVDPASFQTDAQNCGGCGIECGTGTCVGGVCQCEGVTRCDARLPRCHDLQTDPNACGTCDRTCTRPNEGCAGGACACVPPVDDDCGAFCTDTLTDEQNCGLDAASGCGHACTLLNEVCEAGACGCPASFPTPCPAGSPTACVNTQTDANNCGTCANVCPLTNDVCAAGACACPAALPDRCPTVAPTACVNKLTDEQNCGACGTACLPRQTCASGACQCPAGETPCGDACVDLETDEVHCGSCVTACATGATCTSGTCRCPAGPTPGCNGACCAGGTSCCGDASCPLAHSNGVGQTFFDCNPLGTHDLAQATKAAQAWRPAPLNQFSGFQVGCPTNDCLGWQTGSACGVWCYGADILGGRVNVNTISIQCVCPTTASPTWN